MYNIPDLYDYMEEEVESRKEDPKVKCKFELKSGVLCGANALVNNEYCFTHANVRCKICGSQATHVCDEGFKCEMVLCDGSFCSMHHNTEDHSGLWIGNIE